MSEGGVEGESGGETEALERDEGSEGGGGGGKGMGEAERETEVEIEGTRKEEVETGTNKDVLCCHSPNNCFCNCLACRWPIFLDESPPSLCCDL